MPGHLRLDAADVTALPGYDEGAWWVQDISASLPARLLGKAKDGGTALDLCAAPGGKTLQLAAAGWETTGVELAPTRLARLRDNLIRTALPARLDQAVEQDRRQRAGSDGGGEGLQHGLAGRRRTSSDGLDPLPPPSQADFASQRVGDALGHARQFVVERVDSDHRGAGGRIGNEAAGQPAVGSRRQMRASRLSAASAGGSAMLRPPAGRRRRGDPRRPGSCTGGRPLACSSRPGRRPHCASPRAPAWGPAPWLGRRRATAPPPQEGRGGRRGTGRGVRGRLGCAPARGAPLPAGSGQNPPSTRPRYGSRRRRRRR